jgi:geranylgeranyl pyrophosphate synthase
LQAPGKSLRRDFVELGWEIAYTLINEQALIGAPSHITKCPKALIYLVELLHSGSLIVDDIEDQSQTRRGQPCLHRQIGLAPALNIGNWLYFVSAHMIERLDCRPETRANIYAQLNRVMLRCHQGQAIDVSCQVTRYTRSEIPLHTETSTKLKTGVLVGFAIQLGALALEVDEDHAQSLYRFGEKIGLALQMYDDLSGFLNDTKWHKGCEDISRQRLTWVWSWIAQNPALDDQTFNEIMDELKSLSLEQGSKPITSEEKADEWTQKALALRAQCRPLLEDAEAHIHQVISDALTRLSSELRSDNACKAAYSALHRLKQSYL